MGTCQAKYGLTNQTIREPKSSVYLNGMTKQELHSYYEEMRGVTNPFLAQLLRRERAEMIKRAGDIRPQGWRSVHSADTHFAQSDIVSDIPRMILAVADERGSVEKYEGMHKCKPVLHRGSQAIR